MANGDDALAAGMDVLSGDDDRRNGWDEINKSRDYIAQRTAAVTPVEKGGTGATTPTAALANLGALPRSEVFDGTGSIFNKVPRYDADGRLICATPTALNHAVPLLTLNGALDQKIGASGGTITGTLYVQNATPATSGYTVCYLNSDGRVSKGASSERYKRDIVDIEPATLGDLFPQLVSFIIRGDETNTPRVGHIAERLAEHPDQQPFVVYDAEDRPDSIDFISLLLAQTAQLHQRVQQLERDHEVLATGLDLLAQRLSALEA